MMTGSQSKIPSGVEDSDGRSPYQRLRWLGRQSVSASKVRTFGFGRERDRIADQKKSPVKKDGN